MKHTEEQIIDKAKQILKDLLDKFYSDELIGGTFFEGEEVILFGKYEGQKRPVWTVSIEALFDNIDFLYISDETGEPLYCQNFNTFIYGVEKNSKGKYFKISN